MFEARLALNIALAGGFNAAFALDAARLIRLARAHKDRTSFPVATISSKTMYLTSTGRGFMKSRNISS